MFLYKVSVRVSLRYLCWKYWRLLRHWCLFHFVIVALVLLSCPYERTTCADALSYEICRVIKSKKMHSRCARDHMERWEYKWLPNLGYFYWWSLSWLGVVSKKLRKKIYSRNVESLFERVSSNIFCDKKTFHIIFWTLFSRAADLVAIRNAINAPESLCRSKREWRDENITQKHGRSDWKESAKKVQWHPVKLNNDRHCAW